MNQTRRIEKVDVRLRHRDTCVKCLENKPHAACDTIPRGGGGGVRGNRWIDDQEVQHRRLEREAYELDLWGLLAGETEDRVTKRGPMTQWDGFSGPERLFGVTDKSSRWDATQEWR